MPTKTQQSIERLDDIDGLERSLTAKERKAIPLEDFAWPEKRKYPIDSQDHLDSAATLIGRAPEAMQAKIKARAKSIAKRKGFTLPDTWQDGEDAKSSSDRAAVPDDPLNDILDTEDDSDANEDAHAVMDALESIVEDEVGDDDSSNDVRGTPSATIERTLPAPDVSYYAPITRIDREKREVIGTATAEIKDAYRTVIGYEASKDAFQRWRGNIREMHDAKKAVGRALEIIPDDDHRRIVVRAKISKGAQDTWEKILDGTLTGFSIGGKNGVWTKRVVDGEELDYLERYDQAELSVVDNPACPTANFDIVRADGMASDILAKDDELNPKPPETPQPSTADSVERAGARLSKETQDAMHMARDHAKSALTSTCQTCGCDECNDHMDALMQIGKNDDNDGDVDANYLAPASMRRLVADIVRSEIAEAMRAQLAPTLSRVNALLASDAQRSESPDVTRRVDDLSVDITAIKDLVERIAAQPVDGGPVLHGGPGVAQDKRLALQGSDHRNVDDAEAIRRAVELGFTMPSSQEAQVLAASKLVRR
jgi:hypothetical protein